MPLFMKRLLCMIFHVPLFTKPFSYVTPYVSVLMLYSIITAQLLMYHICTLVFYCYLQIILYFYTPPIFITVPPYHSTKSGYKLIYKQNSYICHLAVSEDLAAITVKKTAPLQIYCKSAHLFSRASS